MSKKGYKQSESHKRKIGEANKIANKGKKLRLGKKHTKEAKRRMSLALKGKPSPNLGKHTSDITKKKISESLIEYFKDCFSPMLGKHHSEESKQKMRNAHKGKHSGKKSNFWKGGKSFESYSVDWTNTLKRAIRERDNYICQICSQYGNHVHHIDYDKKNCNPDNLVTLCIRCHSKTSYNRNYWKNYFSINMD